MYCPVPAHCTAYVSPLLQVVKAFAEAEKYPGVSLLLVYAPCALHGIEGGMCNALDDAKEATDTGGEGYLQHMKEDGGNVERS